MEQKYQPKPDVDGMSPGAENGILQTQMPGTINQDAICACESHRIGRKRPLAPRSSAV